ncbi:hypothetical protein DFJ77DRAFT_515505 [Powellomyces hirtus]|nr:hypothetical protein DFJ77DRAFT_515720 [Powellomyces hirtus]KAI8904217.1 hypothetical protein DFJ77DRAFT_515505 [Powellomyces hirtus]
MSVPVENLIPVQAGTLIAGIVATVSFLNLDKHGVSVNLITDNNRQKFLNLIGFIVAIAGIISIGLNQTGEAYVLNNVCIIVIFLGIQLGLCCVIHNTIVRAFLCLSWRSGPGITTVSKACLTIYPLVIMVLIPIYIGFTQVDGKAVNTSEINKTVFKPLNIALVVSTQLLATISDVVLLRMLARSMLPAEIGSRGISRESVSAPLMKQYILIWVTVVLDVLIKILIYQGQPVLFDSQISNMTLVFRAQTNLTYGLNLKSLREKSPFKISSNKLQGSNPVLQGSNNALAPKSCVPPDRVSSKGRISSPAPTLYKETA